MKILTEKGLLLMISTMVLSQASGVFAQSRTSFAGHVFTQVSNHPELGDAWKDDTGKIWGDAVLNTNKFCANSGDPASALCLMHRTDAIQYCKSIGATLPTHDDFVELDRLIGDSKDTMDITDNFIVDQKEVEVIPHLMSHVEKMIYWSSTINPADPSDAGFILDYGADAALNIKDNDVISDYLEATDAVRCVEHG